jgi:hypothetical protein
MRKIVSIAFVIISLGAVALFFATRNSGVHHTAERRSWKNAAIIAITNDLKDPNHLNKRFPEAPKRSGGLDPSERDWLTSDTILCRDSSWLSYRGHCHKQDRKVHDIFIGKASDGMWYYSDYHFCKEMMMLASNGQPKSLEEFKKEYFLVRFDGFSDIALRPTWNIGGEPAASGNRR